mgnify:CR=1 FL=1
MRKMSGTAVAKKLGISAQYYYDLELGKKSLSTEYTLKLAEIFDVSLEILLGLPSETKEKESGSLSTSDSTPSWASSKDKRDFKKMLEEDAPVMFDGVPIVGEARQRVLDVLTGLFWEAKEMNKKTYGRQNNNKNNTNDDKE